MLYDVGSTISLEAWDDRLKPNQDWNHAWGAAPANLIPRRLMGVRPLAPGFDRILIHPQPGGLAYADLTMPTVRGPVRVAVTQSPAGAFVLETETPGNTTTQVRLPRLGRPDAVVIVNGRTVAAAPQGDWLVVGGIGSGRHTFVRTG